MINPIVRNSSANGQCLIFSSTPIVLERKPIRNIINGHLNKINPFIKLSLKVVGKDHSFPYQSKQSRSILDD